MSRLLELKKILFSKNIITIFQNRISQKSKESKYQIQTVYYLRMHPLQYMSKEK